MTYTEPRPEPIQRAVVEKALEVLGIDRALGVDGLVHVTIRMNDVEIGWGNGCRTSVPITPQLPYP